MRCGEQAPWFVSVNGVHQWLCAQHCAEAALHMIGQVLLLPNPLKRVESCQAVVKEGNVQEV